MVEVNEKQKLYIGALVYYFYNVYNLEYIKFGFIASCVNKKEQPMCVICLNTFSNDSIRPVKFSRHLKASEQCRQVVFFDKHTH